MWKIRKFSLQSGLELMTTRMIDEDPTNWTTEAGILHDHENFQSAKVQTGQDSSQSFYDINKPVHLVEIVTHPGIGIESQPLFPG